MNLDLFSAFVIGLLGSGHCILMCGGITTMLTSALPSNSYAKQIPVNSQTITDKPQSKALLIVGYHIGRITSYSFIGGLVGFTGSIAAKNIGMPIIGLKLISALFIILLGLYIGQWFMGLTHIESIGKRLWKYISPFAKNVIPVTSPIKAFSLGAIWGWLPCGLVYSTLTWALASGDMLIGAEILFFFGLGTLPALLTLSLSINSLKSILTNPFFKKLMALILIGYGIFSFIVAYQQMF